MLEAIIFYWACWVLAAIIKIVVLPIISLTYLESAGEFRRVEWSLPPEQVALPVLASGADARRGPGKLIGEASGVHARPLQPLPAPSGVRAVPPRRRRMSEFAFIEQEPNQGAEHAVESGTTIGREGCDITLADPDVSRRHATIQIVGRELSIEDLGSTNGTFVNGEAITARRSAPRRRRGADRVERLAAARPGRGPRGCGRPAPDARPASQATTLRPAAAPAPAEPPSPRAGRPRAGPPPSRGPEPRAPEPRAPEPVAPSRQPPRRPPPTARPATPPPAAEPAPSRRGDVPQPDFAPSGIRRIVPVDVPTAFTPETQGGRKGSAATRAGATAMATVVVALTTAGVVLYYITEPFK